MTPRTLRTACALALLALCLPALAAAQTYGPRRAFMDTTCGPCQDFYRYANGGWVATAKIPPAYVVAGRGRDQIDRNQATLLQVLERSAAGTDTEKDPTLRKLGWLYAVLMDSTRADREGLDPVRGDLDRIGAIRTKADLLREFAHPYGFAPFEFGPEVDPRRSTVNIGALQQGGLGLPERDYYFRTDPKSDTLRQAYVAHVARTLELLGTAPEQARADADRVMKLETALAESSLTAVQRRDPEALCHKMTVKQLQELCPAVEWVPFFAAVGAKRMASPSAIVDVNMPGFMRRLSGLVDGTPIEDWRAYLRFHTARGALPWLGERAYAEAFSFTSRLTGQKVPQPRWKRASAIVDGSMGEALGKAYVETEFPPSSKARMVEIVNNLRAALKERIETRPWMSDATRKQALVKLAAVLQKIGYPDKWRDYTALRIDPKESAIANLRRVQELEQKRALDRIGRRVDRSEWGMTTPTVNAYYNPPTNEICFPAGILQRPMFDPDRDDAANYGAIGAVIGHELTHGFDDEGRKYDALGNLKDWWTGEDGAKFEARSQKLVSQYDRYVGVDTLHVNGRLTLGENIGDVGGLTVAYHAWKLSLRGRPAPTPVDGFTPEQRFFLGYAEVWRRVYRPETLRLLVQTDPHSPNVWRVNGVVANLPEFAQAFGCHTGDPMVLDEDRRADIW